MAYVKKTWENDITQLNADNLNNIENGIQEALDSASTNATNISTVTKATETNASLISGLEEDISDLNTRVGTAEENIVTNRGNIENLETDVSRLESSIMGIQENVNPIGEGLLQHITNYENPHRVTASQVGSYTKSEVDALLEDVDATVSVDSVKTGMCSTLTNITLDNISPKPHNLYIKVENQQDTSGQLWTHMAGSFIDEVSMSGIYDTLGWNLQSRPDVSISQLKLKDIACSTFTSYDNVRVLDTDYNQYGLMFMWADIAYRSGYEFVLVLDNVDRDQVFVVNFGTQYTEISAYISGTKLCVCTDGDKQSIDVPSGTKIRTFGYVSDGGIANGYVNVMYVTQSSFQFDATTIGSKILYEDGTYYLPINENNIPNTPNHTAYLINTTGIPVYYEIGYMKDTELVNILKYVPKSEVDKEDIINEIQNVISCGTEDPDGSTPGLFYFKFVE